MRKKIVAGNWKMNNNKRETAELIQALKSLNFSANLRVMIAPAFTHLVQAEEMTRGSHIEVMAQNMNAAESGAFTGEISAAMLSSIGIKKVILGHSERRAYYNENDASLKGKVTTALSNDMEIIFCFGEELDQRKSGSHFEVVKTQLETALFDLSSAQWSKIILAYEPVWAIGTGETASPEKVQEMHAYVRSLIALKYEQTLADSISILYGGSVKPDNASAIFSQFDVDGGLIGGAALKAEDFWSIIQST
ncbi:triose-phosphate isomerase [Flavobacteriaceae bacterium]|nr:triose-phosphate isomerase [Flavobacteriaceae bacterium]